MNLWADVVYSVRLLKRNFGFTLLCSTVIALGMGISLVLYSLADNIALKTLPFDNGDKFVVGMFSEIEISGVGFDYNDRFDPYRLQHFKDNTESYSTLGGIIGMGLTISDGDSAEVFFGTQIDPALLAATGILPLLGRSLQTNDSLNNRDLLVLISHSLWQNYYTGRADIIGHQSKINGEFYTIIGVMPEEFSFPGINDAWFPLRLPVTPQPGVGPTNIMAVGILAEGISLENASNEFSVLNQNFQDQESTTYEITYDAYLKSYRQAQTFGSEYVLVVTLSVTAMIILLIIFNISNLFTVRSQERIQELAIRSSVGATQSRMIQVVMLESLIISIIGTAAGLTFAHLSLGFVGTSLSLAMGLPLPSFVAFKLDANLICAAIVMCSLIWIGSGIFPAMRVCRQDINLTLADTSKGTISKGGIRFTKFLVNLQVVVCCFLLIITGCMIQYLRSSQDIELGIAQGNYVTAQVSLTTEAYSTDLQKQQYVETLQSKLLEQNGIYQTTITSNLPGTATDPGSQTIPYVPYNLEDRDLLDNSNNTYPFQFLVSVTNNYFDFFDAQLITGRTFNATDSAGSQAVVVIEKTFADRLWPNESPLGKRIQVNPQDDSEWLNIIGVVSSIRHDSPVTGPDQFNTTLFRPLTQNTPSLLRVAVKVDNPEGSYLEAFKRSAANVDRNTPITAIISLDQLIKNISSFAILLSNIFIMVATVALLVAGCGIYGVMARSADRRTGEIGMRRALGANNAKTLQLFLQEGVFILILGLVIGGMPALFAIYGLAAFIPALLGYLMLVGPLVVALITAIVLLAAYLPARKIIAMEPGDALRYE